MSLHNTTQLDTLRPHPFIESDLSITALAKGSHSDWHLVRLQQAQQHRGADGKASCHAGALQLFWSASVPVSCSGDSQLWRSCEKLKGTFSYPANLTHITQDESKDEQK
ncbi:hypothetical protein Q8A73_011139 [Channa argus]|nr:hypothetical protein Q8A73_011139 [Channa argus]